MPEPQVREESTSGLDHQSLERPEGASRSINLVIVCASRADPESTQPRCSEIRLAARATPIPSFVGITSIRTFDVGLVVQVLCPAIAIEDRLSIASQIRPLRVLAHLAGKTQAAMNCPMRSPTSDV